MSDINCKEQYGFKYWDDLKGCTGVYEFGMECPLEDDMVNAFGTDGSEWVDKLDKPATEISVWDVYSPSELL